MNRFTNGDTIPIRVPMEQSIKDAEELVEDMRKRFPIRGANGVLQPEYGSLEICLTDGQISRLGEEIDNGLPHYTAFAVGGGKKVLKSNWAGQILVNVNAVLNMMRVNVFDYNPKYSKEVLDSVECNESSEKLWEEVYKNMHVFETARQLALQIPLKKISSVQLMADSEVGILEISLVQPESDSEEDQYHMFLQRFIATNMKQHNKMKDRSNFLPFSLFESQPYTLLIGGPVDELSDVQALLLTAEPRLKFEEVKDQAAEGTSKQNHQVKKGKGGKPSTSKGKSPKEKGPAVMKINGQVRNRRKSILDVLLRYRIISEQMYTDNLNKPEKKVGRSRKPANNHLGGLTDLNPCLYDYVNFHCKNVRELEGILSNPLKAADYGYDLELDCIGIDESELKKLQANSSGDSGNDDCADKSVSDLISNMEVGHFVALNKDGEMYYSFCRNQLMHEDHDSHCAECMRCWDWHFWHCYECNRCSYGQSIPKCEHCGSRELDDDDSNIRPLSLRGYRNDRDNEFEMDGSVHSFDEEDDHDIITEQELEAISDATWGTDIIQLTGPEMNELEEEEDDVIELDSDVEEELMEPRRTEKYDRRKKLMAQNNEEKVKKGADSLAEESPVKKKRKTSKKFGEKVANVANEVKESKFKTSSAKGKQQKQNCEDVAAKHEPTTLRLEDLLCDPLGLMDQPSSVLGPAYRRKASKLKGRLLRHSKEGMKQNVTDLVSQPHCFMQ